MIPLDATRNLGTSVGEAGGLKFPSASDRGGRFGVVNKKLILNTTSKDNIKSSYGTCLGARCRWGDGMTSSPDALAHNIYGQVQVHVNAPPAEATA